MIEYFVGYEVYYIRKNNEWAGYCVISNGKNRRYSFSTSDDIIFGRYMICEPFRGQGLSKKMLKTILMGIDLKYKHAYAFVHESNIPSNRALQKIGCKEIKRFFITGFFRRLSFDSLGDYILYEFNREGKIS